YRGSRGYPLFRPTAVPEDTLSSEPTAVPEDTPSSEPTAVPEDTLSSEPTAVPEDTPSSEPTAVPKDASPAETAPDLKSEPDVSAAADDSISEQSSEDTVVIENTSVPSESGENTSESAETDVITEEPAPASEMADESAADETEGEAEVTAIQSVLNFLGLTAHADEPAVEELKAQLADAQARLDQLNADIAKAEKDLNSLNSSLENKKSDLSSKKSALETLEGDNENIQSRIEEAGRQIASLTERIAALDIEILKLDAQIAAGNENTAEVLSKALAVIDQSIREIESSDAYKALALIKDPESLNAAYAQAQQGLAQIDAGVAQMDAMLEKLNKGIIPGGIIEGIDEDTALGDAKDELKNARKKAVSAFSDAEDQLEKASAELANARHEFNTKRDEALENAGLDGVITVEMVSGILGAQNFSMPAGYVYDVENDQILVRVGDKFTSLDELRQMKLFELGLEAVDEVHLLDVASVEITDNRDEVFTKLDGSDGILLSFEKQSTYSTAEVAEAILDKADTLIAADPSLHITNLMDQGEYITIIVDSVLSNLLSGGALAILVLLLFLMDWRPTVTVAFSIPISVVVAFVCMYFSGITLNVLSLSGLSLGIGMLVDNSIVAIENIYRLHEEERMPLLKSCVVGVQKVSGAMFSSTLTTICVFLPVVFTEGMAKDLFTDMGLTIAYSLLASLVVAMTVVPAMSSFLMKRSKPRKHRIFAIIQSGYLWLLKGALKAKFLVILASVALLAFSVMQVSSMGISFMPEVNSTQMSATLYTDPESSVKDQQALALNIMNDMMEVEGVESIGLMGSGSSSLMSAGGDGSMSYYIIVDAESGRKNRDIAADMAAIGKKYSADLAVQASTMDLSMMTGSGISVNITGEDLNVLQSIALDIAAIAEQVDGAVDIDNGLQESVPEMHISVDKEKAIDNGLTVAQVYQYVAQKLYGAVEITQVTIDGNELSVYIVDSANESLTPEDVENFEIEVAGTTETKMVRVGDIADVEDATSLTTINRASQRRQVTVSFGIADGYSANLVSRDLEALLEDYTVPDGYDVSLGGENEMVMSIMEDLILMIVVAVIMIFLIMVAQFQSFKSPIIVMFTIPLAFTGGMIALILTGMDLSIVSMLGFLVLSGVVVNNGIVFIDCVNQLRIEGYEKKEALLEAGRQRLRPILMTAMTTILGMSTMALAQGAGAEMMQPMAVVSIGGLTYSTLMTLFVVPVLYDIFNGKKLRAREVMMMREAAGLTGDEVLDGDSVTDSLDAETAMPADAPVPAAPVIPAVPAEPSVPAATAAANPVTPVSAPGSAPTAVAPVSAPAAVPASASPKTGSAAAKPVKIRLKKK
ncbi:MAG: efflux RND transporter permease subunit, partial [Clostridia bacterium]|nr:efflux RND transporter permease subunit [Clostridia bacterium]